MWVLKPAARPPATASSSSVYLVFQGAVLALGLLADDDQVQIVVASAVARQAVHMDHISKQVQFTPGEWVGKRSLLLLLPENKH